MEVEYIEPAGIGNPLYNVKDTAYYISDSLKVISRNVIGRLDEICDGLFHNENISFLVYHMGLSLPDSDDYLSNVHRVVFLFDSSRKEEIDSFKEAYRKGFEDACEKAGEMACEKTFSVRLWGYSDVVRKVIKGEKSEVDYGF